MTCSKCGQTVADGEAFCPNCGAPMEAAANTNPATPNPANNNAGFQGVLNQIPNGGPEMIPLILGIASIVLGIVGGIMFGIFGGLLGCIAGVVGLVMSINLKKTTNNAKGGAAFVCSIIGVIFSAIFFAGCGICGICESSSIGTRGYTCYGCVGARCMAQRDVNNALDELNDLFNSLY